LLALEGWINMRPVTDTLFEDGKVDISSKASGLKYDKCPKGH